jgi:hypothetical protein
MHVEAAGFHWVVYPSIMDLGRGRCWATRLPANTLLDPGCAWLALDGLFVVLEREADYYKVLTGEGFVGWIVAQNPELYFKEVASE